MSHISRIKSVPIRSISALRAAVDDLKQQGVECELRENAVPRLFSQDQLVRQMGRKNNVADFVLHLPGSRYDVAFIKEKEDSDELTPVFDPWDRARGVACQIGNNGSTDAHCMGRFLQAYTKAATIEAAVSKGYSVLSCDVGTDGKVKLQLAAL